MEIWKSHAMKFASVRHATQEHGPHPQPVFLFSWADCGNSIMIWAMDSNSEIFLKLLPIFKDPHIHLSFQNLQSLYLVWNITFWLQLVFMGSLACSWWGPYYDVCISSQFTSKVSFGLCSFKFSLGQHLPKMTQTQSRFTIASTFAWFWMNSLSKNYKCKVSI